MTAQTIPAKPAGEGHEPIVTHATGMPIADGRDAPLHRLAR